jgi:hypothetical protein
MDKTAISFRPTMLGHELADAIKSLDSGLKTYAQDICLESGEFVIHLRKPSLDEKIKMALMPKEMKADRMALLFEVITSAARSAGVDGDQLIAAVRAGRSGRAVKAIRDAGIRVALQNSVNKDFF